MKYGFTSLPKAGTHMLKLVYEDVVGQTKKRIQYSDFNAVDDFLANDTTNKFFRGHIPFSTQLYNVFIKHNIKILFLKRNMKDIVVSAYNFLHHESSVTCSFEDYIQSEYIIRRCNRAKAISEWGKHIPCLEYERIVALDEETIKILSDCLDAPYTFVHDSVVNITKHARPRTRLYDSQKKVLNINWEDEPYKNVYDAYMREVDVMNGYASYDDRPVNFDVIYKLPVSIQRNVLNSLSLLINNIPGIQKIRNLKGDNDNINLIKNTDQHIIFIPTVDSNNFSKRYVYSIFSHIPKKSNGIVLFLEKNDEPNRFVYRQKAHSRYFRQVNNK